MSRYREDRVVDPARNELLGRTTVESGGVVYYTQNHYYTFSDALVSVDSCEDELHPGPPYYTGGPLVVHHWKDTRRLVRSDYHDMYTGTYRYRGHFCLNTSYPLGYGYQTNPNYGAAADYSAQAWNRLMPDRPLANLGQFIGEAKDIPRMFKQTAETFHDSWKSFKSRVIPKKWDKRTSNEWINANFGWLPFVNDFCDFIEVVNKFDDRYRRYVRNAGHWFKRKVRVRVEDYNETIIGSDTSLRISPSLVTSFYSSPYGTTTWGYRKSKEVWAEGRVKYYLPQISESHLRGRYLRRLLGLELSPSLLYNLTPWSWLLDWFSNMGDIFENLSSSNYIHNNLVSKYAFCMCHTNLHGFVKCTANFKYSPPITLEGTVGSEFKTRISANPFGFGLNWEDLSSRQLSILTALGITRVR